MATVVVQHADGNEFFDSKTLAGAMRKAYSFIDKFAAEYEDMAREHWRKTTIEPGELVYLTHRDRTGK